MTNPLVTILISTYNRPRTLKTALRSIYNQTYQNFEVRLTRDGGTPVDIWDFNDKRMHFINRDENKGLAYSFNESIVAAKGEYVCYLGDDDLFYPDHIETLVRALQSSPDYKVAYTDLYKVHCRIEKNGRRTPMAKNIEVSRDFDRMSLLRFNNMLHVSLMHTLDMFNLAGLYDPKITSLLDWDINRRMCFYTDFLHVNVVTGEYYAPMQENDRISFVKRCNPPEFIVNQLKIRHTRPPKPWPKVKDLAILIPMTRWTDNILKILRDLHLHTWYPHRIYLTCPADDIDKIKTPHPNVTVIRTARNIGKEIAGYFLNARHEGDLQLIIEPDKDIIKSGTPWIEGAVNAVIERK